MTAQVTSDEALIIARHIAAGASAIHGCSPAYCEMMRAGRYDEHESMIAAHAALMLSEPHLAARLKEIRESKSNVVEIAA